MACGFAVFAVAGCSSDASSAPTTPPAVLTTTAVSSVPDSTTTSTTTSTSSTSTSTTSTLPAATTTLPTEALIKQAVQDYHAAYWNCGQSPAACDPATFTAIRGKSRSTITELVQGFVQQGLHSSVDLRGSSLVVESTTTNSSTEVAATSCWYDAGIVLGPLGPDGQPTIVNDEITSIRYNLVLYLEHGQWRVGEQLELERLGVGNLCPPVS